MAESTQHWLDKNRKPRVQITYDVETGDAIQKKELPLVAGILADLSGNAAPKLPPLKERKFVEIDRDNFDKVLESIHPMLQLKVKNVLPGAADDAILTVNLAFEQLADFDPIPVLKQVPDLAALFEARQRLSDLATKLDGNDAGLAQLRTAEWKPEDVTAVKGLLGPAPADDPSKTDA
jgi:type VI secretion system protein ImpB